MNVCQIIAAGLQFTILLDMNAVIGINCSVDFSLNIVRSYDAYTTFGDCCIWFPKEPRNYCEKTLFRGKLFDGWTVFLRK